MLALAEEDISLKADRVLLENARRYLGHLQANGRPCPAAIHLTGPQLLRLRKYLQRKHGAEATMDQASFMGLPFREVGT